MKQRSPDEVRSFFAWSDCLDYMVLRPLSHIAGNWEAKWDHNLKRYAAEEQSFAEDLNIVIDSVSSCIRPDSYHDYEDALCEQVVLRLNWPIQKKGNRWTGADYASILEQGSFDDLNQQTLIRAVAGRVQAAMDRAQTHFDKVQFGHLYMIAALLSIIIYQRYCSGNSMLHVENE